MAKVIAYKFLSYEADRGTKENPEMAQIFQDKVIRCEEADLGTNEEIAKREAYNGEYTVEDDGMPEPEPTDAERIGDLEAALDLLLSGVTE